MNIPRRIANAFGYDVLRTKTYQPTLEAHLDIVFRHLGIDLVLDVGANNGGYGRMLRQLGYKGAIVSFEPVDDCFNQLQAVAKKDPNWLCHHFALGANKDEQVINVPASSDFASFLAVSEKAREIWSDDFSKVKTQKVQISRLDDIFGEILDKAGKNRRIFLKMDTQGYDLEVFSGGLKSPPPGYWIAV